MSTTHRFGLILGVLGLAVSSVVAARPTGNAAARIEVLPDTVWARSLVRLRLVDSPADPTVSLRWAATGGVLHSDDLPEVEWRAPVRAADCRVRVYSRSQEIPQDVLLAELAVVVKEPSTTGMVLVPGGDFLRGDVRGTRNTQEIKTIQNAGDEPAYRVRLKPYWIDQYPVTHRQYAQFLEASVAQGLARVEAIAVLGYFEGAWVPFYYFQSYEKLVPYYHDGRNARKPEFLHAISHDGARFHLRAGWEDTAVVDVSWFGAAAYASFHGKALPTEAQWEKAARGDDDRRYPWGAGLPTSYHARTTYHSPTEPVPVGRFAPQGDSPHGVSEMLSSNFEWTGDWFNPTYYEDYRGVLPGRDPKGPFWGRAHVIKGLPYGLEFPQNSFDDSEPVSNRYSWFFEFLIGDVFANRITTFRTALELVELEEE